MYTRGAQSDFDAWENEFNNPGWGFKDLLPLFQKVSLSIYNSVFQLYLLLKIAR